MLSPTAFTTFGRRALTVAALTALFGTVSTTAYAQSTGASQKPFIMILMDTSASMEWTDEGDEQYPNNNETGVPEWKAGKSLLDTERYGPCYVWKADCSDYDRPGWSTGSDWSDNYSDSTINNRIEAMRGDATGVGPRLQNKSQPRHVSLKEILSGEMVLRYDGDTRSIGDLNPNVDAPGCWLVPRQRNATAQTGDLCDDLSSSDYNKFDKFPDYSEPRPHFQEVFDGQVPNGLMDTVAGNAIFAVAMFDGYKDREDGAWKDWKGSSGADHLQDPMKDDDTFAGVTEGEGDPTKVGEADKFNYNLGVFQMIGPKSLEMSTSIAGQISSYVQYALIDAGYLRDNEDMKLEPKKADDEGLLGGALNDVLGVQFSDDLDKFVDKYTLGRQPIARATPLAAAMYDIHHYFAHGRKGKLSEDSPIIEDSYKNCRPKHVIMLTDGNPEPELPGGVDVGTNTLSSAFGYDPAQYPYTYTEKAIRSFMTDTEHTGANNPRYTSSPPYPDSYLVGSWDSNESSYEDACKYNPRVHVVGQVGQVDDDGDPQNDVETLEDRVVEKLAAMAIEGRTCAEYYLGADWVPDNETMYDGNKGNCDPSVRACLDARQGEYMDQREDNSSAYEYIKPDGDTVKCRYPALILSTDDPDVNLVRYTADALQLLFNDIVGGGLQSRTRPTFVNRLDDDNTYGGQYRFFSGVGVDNGEIFWRGLLYRQNNVCTASASIDKSETTIHDQINQLAGSVGDPDASDGIYDTGTVTDDRRRIFTSFATHESFDYNTRLAGNLDAASSIDFDRYRFWFGMDLESGDEDQFRDSNGDSTYLGFDPDQLLTGRVPFEFDEFEQVITNLNAEVDPDIELLDYFNALDETDLKQLIHEVRGRAEAKEYDSTNGEGRAFGAILNSSPVAVEPPNLDLPIDSYRAYKAQFADRPSMIYVATTDGLLHGIYSGELDEEPTTADTQIMKKDGTTGSMPEQREAWAYIPQMLHKKLALFKGQQPYLMDGTPSVKDVRLCHGSQDYNLNRQACRCSGSSCTVEPADQWRTVLVQGLGEAGAGYFAVDVTRPGGKFVESTNSLKIEAPDPIPLWEFDSNWERGQVKTLSDAGRDELVYPSESSLRDGSSGGFIAECDDDRSDDRDSDGVNEYFWDQPFLGASVGKAAIGTIALHATFPNADTRPRLRRPVAVISGGAYGEFGTDCDAEQRVGRAIYVIDLQTGTLLRRFVSYIDNESGSPVEKRFQHPITGSPALYNAKPGSLATRGFVGDGAGRLYRIDLSNDDPEDWSVELFFDPRVDIDKYKQMDENDRPIFGPAAYKPALALGTTDVGNDLLVFYGLGERGDLSSTGTKQMMIAVREEISTVENNGDYEAVAEGTHLWSHEFQDETDAQIEKLTSEAVVFNKGLYFTSFVEPTSDRCQAGWSRIYALDFEGDGAKGPKGLWTDADLPSGTNGVGGTTSARLAYEPSNTANLTEPVVVRGLTITLGASCVANPGSATGGTVQQQSKQPTLIAQSSSGAMSETGSDTFDAGDTGELHAIEQQLDALESQHIPLSWAVIDN
jgi:hypothetical protein